MRGQLKRRDWFRPADLARRSGVALNTVINRIASGAVQAEPERFRRVEVKVKGRVEVKFVPTGWRIPKQEIQRIDREGLRPPMMPVTGKASR